MYGYIDTVIWATPGRTPNPQLPDSTPRLELSVSSLPAGIEGPFLLSLGLVVDEHTRVSDCGATKEAASALEVTACSVLRRETFPILNNSEGGPARYLMPFTARFSVDAQDDDDLN